MNEIEKEIKKAIEDDMLLEYLTGQLSNCTLRFLVYYGNHIYNNFNVTSKDTGEVVDIRELKLNKEQLIEFIVYGLHRYNEYYEILFRKFN